MIILKVYDIIGTSNAILHSIGLKLYEELYGEIKKTDKIVLDFDHIDNVTSGFCNASLGKLALEFNNLKDIIETKNVNNPLFDTKIKNALNSNTISTSNNNSAVLDLFN